MARVLYFDSNNVARLVKTKIIDGCVIIDNKVFLVDQSSPLYFKTAFGYEPLFLCKWNDIQPSQNVNPIGKDKLKKLEEVNPEFKDFRADITPEMVRKMTGMTILGNMIKTKKPFLSGFMPVLIGLSIGILTMYLLFYFEVIKF